MRSRKRSSNQRPVNKKNTNMVKESKYTSPPKSPLGSNVAAELSANVMAMPKATGKSMLMRRWRMSRKALLKNGPHEKKTTGKVNTHEAQRSKNTTSGVMSPSPDT